MSPKELAYVDALNILGSDPDETPCVAGLLHALHDAAYPGAYVFGKFVVCPDCAVGADPGSVELEPVKARVIWLYGTACDACGTWIVKEG